MSNIFNHNTDTSILNRSLEDKDAGMVRDILAKHLIESRAAVRNEVPLREEQCGVGR